MGTVAVEGRMEPLIREYDWGQTPLSSMEKWPRSLVTAVQIMLGSRYPMFVWWGTERIHLYNDAYIPLLGKRHPWALGQPARKVWAEIWSLLGPISDEILQGGQSTLHEHIPLIVERNGYPEETYFTFAHSPIPDDQGGIGGIFCTCTEDTAQILSQRRLKTLRELGVRTADEVKTAEEACAAAAATLADNPHDVPFALLYLLDADQRRARLAGSTTLRAGTPASPREIALDAPSSPWPFEAVVSTGEPQLVEPLELALPKGLWPEPPVRALVLPLAKPGQSRPTGLVVAGLSPKLAFDEGYRGFLELMATQIATAIANARAHEDERQRVEALAELDRAKTRFFSNISHELRTPLTLMLGPIEEGLARATTESDRIYMELLHRNALRLQKLVNALLDFSRIETGRLHAFFEPTDLSELTLELLSVFRSAVERAGLRLTVDCPPLPVPVRVDRDMWEKIVLNLVSNALKFTPHGEIKVKLSPVADGIQLIVSDTGVGIEPEHLPHIFERFYRIQESRGRSFEGTGIGLALVRELVKLHGGTIDAQSVVGRGSTFTVFLPTGRQRIEGQSDTVPPRPASSQEAKAFLAEASSWVEPGLPDPPTPEVLFAAQQQPPDHTTRILVADDNADMRAYLARILGPLGSVETVADGVAALEAVQRQPPDIILTDAMMPHLDGFGLLRAIREDDRTRQLPVMVLSARAGEEARVEGIDAGADDYLIKPFSTRELFARTRAVLTLSRERRQAAQRLQESEARFRALANVPLPLWLADAQGTIEFVNQAFCDFFGVTFQTVRSRGWWPSVHPDDHASYLEAFRNAIRTRRPFRAQGRVRRADGQWRWVDSHGLPRFGANGEFLGMAGSSSDITERKEAEDVLREADRRKTHFLGVLSHELRNPLTPIKNSLHILDRVTPGSEQARRAQAVIERQVGLMVRLVDDLLDVTRISRGKIHLQVQRFDLVDLVSRTVDDHRAQFERSGVGLEWTPLDNDVYVEVDWNRMAQVVGNLLQNAVKFTSRGGTCWVSVSCDDARGEAVIRVADSGSGMAPETLERLFQPFMQAEETLDRSRSGLGLGLTLVKGLVELHGGRIEARSDGPGCGAEFIVCLPLAEPRDETAEILPPARKRVLVIEDNVDTAESVREVLGLGGHEVKIAHTGPDGLASAREFQPHLVLCDIGLPGMDGYDVARAIRREAELKDTVLVALSGYAQPEDLQRAFEAGFDRHLAKPASPELLEALVEELP